MNKKTILMIGSIFLLIFSIYLFKYEEKVSKYYKCVDLKEFKENSFNCLVRDRFIDEKNHSSKTIIFNNCENMIVVSSDTSGFYDFVRREDLVVKAMGTDTIKVYRKGKVFNFKIYYFCD